MSESEKRTRNNDCYAKLMYSESVNAYDVFRHNLAALRMKRGMTQEDLAETAGVSRMAVAKWETGRGMPRLENLILLRQIFGVSIDDMLFKEIGTNGKDVKEK